MQLPRLKAAAARAGCLALVSILSAASAQADTLFSDDFSDDTKYTTSTPEANDGARDYFTRTNGSDIDSRVVFAGQDGFFFAAQDFDGVTGSANVSLTWTGIDISGATNLNVGADFAEADAVFDASEDWDADSRVALQVSIDGGPFTTVLAFEARGGTNTEPARDTDFDGVGDGASLTPTFTQFSAPVALTGSTMSVQILIEDLNAGDEDIAFDNLLITGDIGGGTPDITPPTVDTLNPADDSTGVAVDANLVLTFSENVVAGVGDITIRDVAGGSDVEVIDVVSPQIGISGAILTINPSADLDPTTEYAVQIDTGALRDGSGNDFAGILDDTTWSFTTAGAPSTPAVVINEFQYDPAPDATGDANGDGTRQGSEDEFVELYNNSGADLDISGWTLSDAVGERHTFPAGTVIPDRCAIVVFGGGTPVGAFGNALVQTASTGFLGLNNGGDSITLADDLGNTIADHVYVSGDATDQSATRNPDITGSFAGHLTASGPAATLFSPGTRVDGSNFTGCQAPAPVIINEFQSDPAPDTTGDANGDGSRDGSEDEFVELYNNSGSDLDISGWTLSDAVGTRHTFPAGTVVPDQCAIVVFGGGTPFGAFGNALVQTASTGFLGLNNGGDSITVADDLGNTIASHAYVSGDATDQAATRDPDISGGFIAHSLAAGAGGSLFSPGTRLDGSAFIGCSDGPEPTLYKIHEIQGVTDLADETPIGGTGDADESPKVGEFVQVQAVVTSVLNGTDSLGGFYIQEEDADADGNAFTSEGIFVASSEVVSVGNLVTVEGTVAEIEGETRIVASSVSVDAPSSPLPNLMDISLPTPTVLVDTDGDYVANLEAYEGMLVRIAQPLSVTELFQLDRFGTIRVSANGRLQQFTQGNAPSTAGFTQHLKDIAARSLIIDDGLDSQNPDPIFVPGLNPDETLDGGDVFRMGDQFANTSGVLSYSEDDQTSSEEPEYRIHLPVTTLTQNNPRPATPDEVGGDLKVASFNVLNFFTTLDTFPDNEQVGPNGLSPRGADTNPQNALPGTGATDEYDRQLAKLVEAIAAIDADVVGLIEIENDFLKGGLSPVPQSAQDPRDIAIQELVDAINAVSSATYGWVDPGSEFVGGDAIAVGFIYKPASVQPVGDAVILDDPNFLAPNDPSGTGRNRAALAQTFREVASGEDFTAVINHFKSKGASGLQAGTADPDSDQGDGQGFWNDTRTAAAIFLVDWLATDPTGSGDEDFLILGDLNAYVQEDPIQAILDGADDTRGTADDYTDLATQFLGGNAYSFVFDGQVGTLDYALANASLTAQVTGVTEWHINADEPDAFDYNLEFGRDPARFTADAFRASDHDPVIIGLSLSGGSTPVPGDLDDDGDIDRDDLTAFLAFFNQPASGPDDPADVNGDGVINILDYRAIIGMCTRPLCATGDPA